MALADDLKAGDVPLNLDALDASIREGFDVRLQNERAIASAMEQHVTPLKNDNSKAWGELSNDSGIPKKRLRAFYELYKLQEEAKDFEDEDEGNRVLDDMRTIFRALAKGQTLDFVDVLERAA